MLTAGELRHRVSIQARREVKDGHGGYTSSGGSPTTVRSRIAAKVEALASRDLEQARQIDPRASHQVTLRFWSDYVADLAGGRAIVIFHDGSIGDRTFEVIGPPRETEYRVALTLLCKEAR